MDTKLHFTSDHVFSVEDWKALGEPTGMGMLRYESYSPDDGVTISGRIPDDGTVRGRFTNWDPKPRIFREYENGEIELTKDIWR